VNLDDTLAAWAATVRLPDADAAAIYERVTATPVTDPGPDPGLDPRWWRQFAADFSSRMVASTRAPRWAV
jgi:hypothetical protein